MAALIAVETVVLVLLAVLVAGLLRSHAAILRRLHELGAGLEPRDRTTEEQSVPFRTRPGTPDPANATAAEGADITGTGLHGEAIAASVVGAAHDTLLAFLSSTCLTCERFWEAFRHPEALTLPASARLVVVAKDAAEESSARLAELAAPGLDVVLSSEAWVHYQVPGSPYVVYVDGATGHIRGQGTGMSWEQVAGLLAQATGDAAFTTSTRRSHRTRKPASDAEREAAIDRELLAAGIQPGDPSLYTPPGTFPPSSAADRATTSRAPLPATGGQEAQGYAGDDSEAAR